MSLSHPGVATKGKWRSTVIPKLGAPRCGYNDARRAAKKKGMCTLLETYPTSGCESNEGAVVRRFCVCVCAGGSQGCVDTGSHWGGHLLGCFPRAVWVVGRTCGSAICVPEAVRLPGCLSGFRRVPRARRVPAPGEEQAHAPVHAGD